MKESDSNGPKILFIAATHGDEGYSIPIFNKLEEKYPKNSWGYDWIIGNPEAYERKERFTQQDLNRVAPGNVNSPIYEQRRAAELMSIAQGFDIVIDVHGTESSTGAVNIIPYPRIENLALSALFPDLVNIIWYSSKSLKQGPLVQFMNKPAIEIECDKNSREAADTLYSALVGALELKKSMNLFTMLDNLTRQTWYQVVGRQQEYSESWEELKPFMTTEGLRYPFLISRTRNPAAYILEKIDLSGKFLYV